jgi:hypothetical protein
LQFNEDWQSAVEKLTLGEDGDEKNFEVLAELSKNFVAVAQTYGRIIVREMHYKAERKLVKPMDLGGVIGGEKYVISGILFKVANPGLFGDDEEPSQKIAGHELKALTACFNVNQIFKIGFALPMIALLDILGHRLVALALCPLSSKTIIHGKIIIIYHFSKVKKKKQVPIMLVLRFILIRMPLQSFLLQLSI